MSPSRSKKLDVAVVAAARDERAVAHVIEAAVADVRPPAGTLLHQAHRAGGARALLERQLRAELAPLRVRAPSVMCRKPRGSNSGCGVCQKASTITSLRHLGGARAVGMSAHAVDHQQECRVFGHRRSHAVLVLLATAEQADIGVLDPQEDSVHLLDLLKLYITLAHERKP